MGQCPASGVGCCANDTANATPKGVESVRAELPGVERIGVSDNQESVADPGRTRRSGGTSWFGRLPSPVAPDQQGKQDEPPPTVLRIFHFNDVYTLENMAALKAQVDKLGKGAGYSHVITTLAGDFLAPSLLSALDHGQGMVDCMNAIPVNYVCFGNHESDVPPEALQQRVREFHGTWINSNMPDWLMDEESNQMKTLGSMTKSMRAGSAASAAGMRFSPRLLSPIAPKASRRPLPTHCLVKGLDGVGRKVALLGLLMTRRSLYRLGAFGGAVETMQPLMTRAIELADQLEALHPDLDCIIPLTHQDLPDDEQLASTRRFPVILGGHDHEVNISKVDSCHIIKAGQDAENVVIVDLIWPHRAPPGTKPEVQIQMIRLAPEDKKKRKSETSEAEIEERLVDQAMVELVKLRMKPVDELKASTLARFEPIDPPLTSIGVRKGPCSMASLLAAALRDANEAEGALINAGSVRGNKVYRDGVITFAHLTAEVPFPSSNITIQVTGEALSEAVRISRLPWLEDPGSDAPSALHTDPDMEVDVDTGEVFQVQGLALDPKRVYRIVVDAYVVRKNRALKEYAEQNPECIPPDDAGQPAMACLVAYFCKQAWLKLISTDEKGRVTEELLDRFFQIADTNQDQSIDFEELLVIIESKLGCDMASRVLATQMMNVVKRTQDGKCTYRELADCLVAHVVERCISRTASTLPEPGDAHMMSKLSTMHSLRRGSDVHQTGSIASRFPERLREMIAEEEQMKAAEASMGTFSQLGDTVSSLAQGVVSIGASVGLGIRRSVQALHSNSTLSTQSSNRDSLQQRPTPVRTASMLATTSQGVSGRSLDASPQHLDSTGEASREA